MNKDAVIRLVNEQMCTAAGAAAVHEVVAQGFGVVVFEALALVLVAHAAKITNYFKSSIFSH